MKILLIGSGGREHSLALKMKESPKLAKLYIAPGNAGTAEIGENISLKEDQIEELLAFALENKIDLTIVGPEMPLVAGIVDKFESHNLKIIGPNQKAAQLEGSKIWAKQIMRKYNVPSADFACFTTFEESISYLTGKNQYPIVIKADGLAAGKGVTVAATEAEAKKALEDCFINNIFGSAGASVVIEEFLKGEEASILAFVDEDTVIPMASAQDHKAIYNGDKGPNTGGMGAYSPAPLVSAEIDELVLETIFKPLITGLKKEGIIYKGILYAGLMIDKGQAAVVEFNVRFGDPETQVVIPRLKNDLLEVFEAIADNNLSNVKLEWEEQSAVCIVLASGGYPGNYEKGKPVTGFEFFQNNTSLQLVHAGTKLNEQNALVTNGGRVLGVVGLDHDLKSAQTLAYKGVKAISFEKMYYRTDIAAKAFKEVKT
ncbi:phosphoribosylamine--glycine ligase [Candidatus Margulisiibacteriota bacterium]